MGLQEERIIEQILNSLGREGAAQARRAITSSTLRAALRVLVDPAKREVRLFIPHYWAVYVHDGRDAFSAKNTSFLIFFANPQDDPRFPGRQTPQRLADVRKLTPAEFQEGLRINADRRASNLAPFMFVVRSVGPTIGQFFFDNDVGMEGFSQRTSSVESQQARIFDEWVQRELVVTERLDANVEL
jgi:hypothetical protein